MDQKGDGEKARRGTLNGSRTPEQRFRNAGLAVLETFPELFDSKVRKDVADSRRFWEVAAADAYLAKIEAELNGK